MTKLLQVAMCNEIIYRQDIEVPDDITETEKKELIKSLDWDYALVVTEFEARDPMFDDLIDPTTFDFEDDDRECLCFDASVTHEAVRDNDGKLTIIDAKEQQTMFNKEEHLKVLQILSPAEKLAYNLTVFNKLSWIDMIVFLFKIKHV